MYQQNFDDCGGDIPSNNCCGFTFLAGVQGPQGSIGPTGPTGPAGIGTEGPTGPTGPTGPAAGLNAYGGLYSSTGESFQTIPAPTTVTLANPMESYNVTQANNAVTIIEGGNYEVTYTVSATLVDGGDIVVSLRGNNVPIEGSMGTITVPQGGTGNLSKSVITDLEDGSAVSLALMSTTSAGGGTINFASISVKLLD